MVVLGYMSITELSPNIAFQTTERGRLVPKQYFCWNMPSPFLSLFSQTCFLFFFYFFLFLIKNFSISSLHEQTSKIKHNTTRKMFYSRPLPLPAMYHATPTPTKTTKILSTSTKCPYPNVMVGVGAS